MKFLAAAKLVELSEEERRNLETTPVREDVVDSESSSEQTYQSEPVDVPLAPAEQNPVHYSASDVVEEKSFDEIYINAQIGESTYPAERLLRLLDGLRAMDATTRIAAVRAMDEADDNWTIADSVVDAQRKMTALAAYQNALKEQLTEKEQSVSAEIANMKAKEEQAIGAIRQQISELESLLAREIGKTAESISQLESELKAAQQSCERDVKRLQLEIERLREIPVQFSN